jgi:endo-1,4-beta-mannosidase
LKKPLPTSLLDGLVLIVAWCDVAPVFWLAYPPRPYGTDDPTIMAWELINEPRCRNCARTLQEWIEEMAKFVKSLDSKHLLSTGEEGFYTINSRGSVEANPELWALTTGQDFIANHDIPEIDFAVAHLWPDNWQSLGNRGMAGFNCHRAPFSPLD